MGKHGLQLVTLIGRNQPGDSAETIHESFTTVPLTDIYAVIANTDAVDAYAQRVWEQGERIRQAWKGRYTPEQRVRNAYLRQLTAQK